MTAYAFKLAFVAVQVVWMLAILPGHVRGMIVIGCGVADRPAAAAGETACCAADTASGESTDTPSPERRARCAVCYQAHGYTLPPVYDFDLAPTGLCELRRLIEPTRRHLLLCRPTYDANGPPVVPTPV